jgi:hypothetical protein
VEAVERVMGTFGSPLRAGTLVAGGQVCPCGKRMPTVGDLLRHMKHSILAASSCDPEDALTWAWFWCPACDFCYRYDLFLKDHYEHAKRCVSVAATMRVRRTLREQRVWIRKRVVPERLSQVDLFEAYARLDPKAAALERMIRRARARRDVEAVARLEAMLAVHVARKHPVELPKLCLYCDRKFDRFVGGEPRCWRHAGLPVERVPELSPAKKSAV